MKEKYVKCLIIIVVVSLIGLFVYQNINKENKPLPEVKLKEIINKNKSFAIMVQEQSETDKYQEYSSNKWPGDDYKFKEAKCIDSNGDEIKEAVTYEEGKITLTTNKTVYCTIYFDKSIIGKLREKDPNKVLSTEEVGGMYRYQGVGTEEGVDATHKLVDNNYICFGTTNNCGINDDNIDKYMYRIIGVTKDGKLYLIKMKSVKEGDINSFAWNDKCKIGTNTEQDCPGGKCTDWPESLLYKRINGLSNGDISATNGNTNIFVNSNKYEYMNDKGNWYNIILNFDWLYGYVGYVDDTEIDGEMVYGAKNTGLILYDIETGIKPTQTYDYLQKTYVKYKWGIDKSINAKIGLMYLHDYYLAYDSETNLLDNKIDVNWIDIIYNDSQIGLVYDHTIPKSNTFQSGFCGAWVVSAGGGVASGSTICTNRAVRPTLYLSNDIQITGNGTIDNPFLIKL